MLGDKMFSMFLSMVVSIFVVRYLGPEKYGILSYAISLCSFFGIATHMGLNGLAIRELVKQPDNQNSLMGTIFLIKFGSAVLAFFLLLSYIYFYENQNQNEYYVILVVSGIILLKPFEVFDFWFQAKVKAKYSSLANLSSVIVTSILKFVFIALGVNLIIFTTSILFQSLLTVCVFAFYYNKISQSSFMHWKFNLFEAKKLLRESWIIMLGAIFTIIYLKIDQVMIRWLLGFDEVGVYSIAARLSEIWYIIPSLVVSSLFPKLIDLSKKDNKQFTEKLQKLFDFLMLIALIIAILTTVFSKPLISFLYGEEFFEASMILSIHIWAGIFVFMRAAFSKWILIKDLIIFSAITQGLGALSNVLLNLVLITKYGIIGAAIATIVSYAMASYFSLFFHKKTRPVFWMMTRSMLFPFKYLINFLSRIR